MGREWQRAVARVLETGGLLSPHLPDLYRLAAQDGERLLGRRFRSISEADRRDVVHDVLAVALERILLARTPRALFLVSLANRATSLVRRRSPALGSKEDYATAEKQRAGDSTQDEVVALREIEELLDGWPIRDVKIFVGAVRGENREELAVQYATSRANVDQIVCRLRQHLRERLS